MSNIDPLCTTLVNLKAIPFHISMGSLRVYLSPSKFFLKPVHPTVVGRILKYMVLRPLKNAFLSQKVEFISFCSCPLIKISFRFLSSLPQEEET